MQQLQIVLKREVARMLLQGQAGYSSTDSPTAQPFLMELVDDCDRLEGPCPDGNIDAQPQAPDLQPAQQQPSA